AGAAFDLGAGLGGHRDRRALARRAAGDELDLRERADVVGNFFRLLLALRVVPAHGVAAVADGFLQKRVVGVGAARRVDARAPQTVFAEHRLEALLRFRRFFRVGRRERLAVGAVPDRLHVLFGAGGDVLGHAAGGRGGPGGLRAGGAPG